MQESLITFSPGGQPTPEVMTEAELIKFLRLEEIGVKNPAGTLRYYREKGKLCATRISNHNLYTRTSALEFLKELTIKKI